MRTSISILGTGWLGLPLAEFLHNQGSIIKGSTTSAEKIRTLENKSIVPYCIEVKENGPEGDVDGFLSGSEVLIINIPPGLRRNPQSNFVAKIRNLIPFIERSEIKKVLFVSSTAVFADHANFPIITSETTPDATSNSGKQLIEVEQLLLSNPNFDTIILRFGGLYDQRRHPATMLSKRSNIKNPLAPVNLIHLDDCIGIIEKIIESDQWNVTYNAACPTHPPKAEYYRRICKEMGLALPEYDYETPSVGKIVDSKNLEAMLHYNFQKTL